MSSYLKSAVDFGAMLRDNPESAQFYDSCTQTQKQAILLQLHQVQDMKSFVAHLPSAAL